MHIKAFLATKYTNNLFTNIQIIYNFYIASDPMVKMININKLKQLIKTKGIRLIIQKLFKRMDTTVQINLQKVKKMVNRTGASSNSRNPGHTVQITFEFEKPTT